MNILWLTDLSLPIKTPTAIFSPSNETDKQKQTWACSPTVDLGIFGADNIPIHMVYKPRWPLEIPAI